MTRSWVSGMGALCLFGLVAAPVGAADGDERDMGYIRDGDTFQVEASFTVPADITHLCFRNGKPADIQKGTWVDSCCLRFPEHSRPLEFRAGQVTAEVAKHRHRSRTVEADYVSRRTFTTGGWEPFRFVKPGLVAYTKHFAPAHEIPIESPRQLAAIACYGPENGYARVRVGQEDAVDPSGLKAMVSIGLMKRHLAGILSYHPDPLRYQPIVVGDATPHASGFGNDGPVRVVPTHSLPPELLEGLKEAR